nr:hypothetical protein [Tanacetum cinerariifolium]
NSKAYKEYYACAMGEAAPKPKASARKKKGESASSTTPPTPTPTTTVESALRLSATAKDEGTGLRPGVPDVPSDDSEEEFSWNSSDDKDVGGHDEGNKSDESDDEHDEGSDDDSNETVKAGSEKDKDDDDNDDDDDDDEEEELARNDEEDIETGKGGDEVSESKGESDEEETRKEEEGSFDPIPRTPEGSEEESNDEEDQELRLSEEARIQEEEEADELYHDSSSVSSFVTSMLNPTNDVGVEFIFTTASSLIVSLQTPTPIMTPSTIATITTSSEAPIPPPIIPSIILENLPTFISAFRFDERLRSLETSFSEYRQTNPFVDAASAIPGIVHQYMTQQMTDAVREAILIEKMEGNKSIQQSDEQQNLYKVLVEAYDADKAILDTYGESTILKRRREDDDQEGPSAGSDRGSKRQKEGEEPVQTTCQMEEPPHPVFETGADDQPIVQTSQHPECDLARQTDACSSFNELLDTPIDFSKFIRNRLNVDTLTPELLAGPTYELMRGSCNSLTKLKYHLEEVYKATTDQLDWVNPEGQQYPHNLLQPLPLIPDNRGRRVIPFDHFINNDLAYLRGGASSRKYTTSVTKPKAADYGHIKWIKDLEPLNRESALDVYSKRRIIAVTELKIVEWHDYKHLDWISVRRDDDKIYKFKEGDLKRLRLQDIKDMMLLLVQGKLSNLTVEERFAFNVSLRMFTRSIVIKRRVEDLQLGVESYQKRLNLTKPDTYRPDMKRRKAYTAHSNPRGFIYHNKDKKNKLMRIDKLHKFSDGTLNDVRNALDDRLKAIRMQYLPTAIWRKDDKDRAAAMIQAIDKMLKTRRIMRSLEKFAGGRLYEGDFRMLQRTI